MTAPVLYQHFLLHTHVLLCSTLFPHHIPQASRYQHERRMTIREVACPHAFVGGFPDSGVQAGYTSGHAANGVWERHNRKVFHRIRIPKVWMLYPNVMLGVFFTVSIAFWQAASLSSCAWMALSIKATSMECFDGGSPKHHQLEGLLPFFNVRKISYVIPSPSSLLEISENLFLKC